MSYKRAVKKRGKTYGPYIYKSYRDADGKVKKIYIGKVKEKSKLPFIVLVSFLCILLILGLNMKSVSGEKSIFENILEMGEKIVLSSGEYVLKSAKKSLRQTSRLISSLAPVRFTGHATLDIVDSYDSGESLLGDLVIKVKDGELIPGDSKIIVEQQDFVKEFKFSDFIELNAEGNFYVDDKNISGSGKGYGFEGSGFGYPDVYFTLVLEDLESNQFNLISDEIQENISAEQETEIKESGETEENESESVEETSEEQELEETENQEIDESMIETGSLITGSVIAGSGNEVQGIVSAKHAFKYNTNTNNVHIKPDSVYSSYESLSEDVLNLQILTEKIIVSTGYSREGEGFGKEYLGEQEHILKIPLDDLDVLALDGDLIVKLVYDDIVLVEMKKEISVDKSVELVDIKEEEKPVKVVLKDQTTDVEIIDKFPDETMDLNKTVVVVSGGEGMNIITKRTRVVINKPVKWVKKIEIGNQTELDLEIPKQAGNITIKTSEDIELEEEDIDMIPITGHTVSESGKEQGFFTRFLSWFGDRSITGYVIQEQEIQDKIIETNDKKIVDIDEIVDVNKEKEIEVEYYTEPPIAKEEHISNGKRITVSAPDELGYTDVLAYTFVDKKVPINEAGKIKLYWYVTDNNEVIKKRVDFDAYDSDNDGFVDYVEWIVPHLSSQVYELIIEISKAEHLDQNMEFISDIYNEIKIQDDVWSESINVNDYVKVIFEQALGNKNDITIYAKSPISSDIGIYTEQGELIATISGINGEGLYKTYLTGLDEGRTEDVFYLRVLGSPITLDYIVDPLPAGIQKDWHLNLQTTDDSGNIVTGTFNFTFNISTSNDETNTSAVVYSTTAELTTDSRGVISYYLEDVDLPYDQQYYLHYYRDGSLRNSSQVAPVPYALRAGNVSLSGVEIDTNFDLGSYNFTTDGYVGIGTDSPGAKLEVNNGAIRLSDGHNLEWGDASVQIDANSASEYFRILTSNSERVRVDSSGNLGIGTTTPTQKLDVNGSVNVSNAAGKIYTPELCLGGDCQTGWPAGSGESGWNDTGTLVELITSSDNVSAGTFYIDNTNSRVGIGTTTPTGKLELASGDILLQNWNQYVRFGTTGGYAIGRDASNNLLFNTSSITRMVIDGNGYVGIGTTGPGTKLDIKSAAANSDVMRILASDSQSIFEVTEDSSGNGLMDIMSTLGAINVRLRGSGDNYINSGNVGIGTDSPQDKVHIVSSAGDPQLYLTDYTGTERGEIGYGNVANVLNISVLAAGKIHSLVMDADNIPFSFDTDAKSGAMVILDAGNVGIGTSSPEANLDVRNTTGTAELYISATDAPNSNALIRFGSRNPSGSWTEYGQLKYDGGANYVELGSNAAGDIIKLHRSASSSMMVLDNEGIINMGSGDLVVNTTDGYVGIGTSTPEAKLHIIASASNLGLMFDNADYISWDDSGGTRRDIMTFDSSNDVRIRNPSGDILLHPDTSGNVGIGTTSPFRKLHLMGTAGSRQHFAISNSDFVATTTGSALLMGFGAVSGNTYSEIQAADVGASSAADLVLNPTGGNVGIGTTSPQTKLDVNGSIRVTNIVTNKVVKFDGTDLDDSIIYDNGTNIGIGTTSPGAKLTISQTAVSNDYTEYIRISSTGTQANSSSGIDWYDYDNSWNSGRIEVERQGSDDSFDMLFYTRDGATNTLGERMRIDDDGRVGIGTTSPSGKLHISDSSAPIFFIERTGINSRFDLHIDSSGHLRWHDDVNDKYPFYIQNNSANNALVIATGGNVGIGTTSPGGLLHLNASSGTTDLKIESTSDARVIFNVDGNDDFTLGVDDNIGDSFRINRGGSLGANDDFIIDSNGNIGIGTATPTQLLHLNKSGNAQELLWGDDTYKGALYKDTSTGYIGVGTFSDHDLRLFTNSTSTNGIIIKNTGNIGVGTSTPSEKLHVADGGKLAISDAGDDRTTTFEQRDNGNFLVQTSIGGIGFGTAGATDEVFIKAGGNVGIGTTSPEALLHIKGSGIAQAIFEESATGISNTIYRTSANDFTIAADNSPNIIEIRDYSGSQGSGLVIDTSGNIGIGTTTPDSNLDVTHSAGSYGTAGIISQRTDASDNVAYGLYNTAQKWDIVSITSATPDYFAVYDVTGSKTPFKIEAGTNTNTLVLDSNGRVGIGTASPDTNLEIYGSSAHYEDNIRYYRNVVQYSESIPTVTGTMKITMPKNWSNTMMHVRIQGYDYASNYGQWEVIVSGYNYAPNTAWGNYAAEIRGSAPFNQVRLAHDGTKNIILLGTTSTTWHYPKIVVSEFIAGHSGRDGWGSGWTIENITSETGIQNIVTPPIRMYMKSDGNVGIGTTDPSEKLDVNGDIEVSGIVTVGGIQGAGLQLSDEGSYQRLQSFSNNPLAINPLGNNVGIGTTSPTQKLDINGSLNISDSSGKIYTPELCLGGDCETSWPSIAGESGWNDTGTLVELVTATDNVSAGVFYIDNTNSRVGVGTTTPNSRLEIKSPSVAGSALRIIESGSAQFVAQLYEGGSQEGTLRLYDGNGSIGTQITGGSGYSYILDSNVGIGTTDPQAKLVILGASDIAAIDVGTTGDASLYLSENENDFTNNGFQLKSDGLNNRFDIISNYAGSSGTRLTILNAGNVGIGTTSPNRKLEINGTESSLLRINREDNDYGGSIEFYRQGSPEWYLKGGESSGADNFAILNSAAEPKFSILQNGNVGISTVSPSQRLDINGSINISDPSGAIYTPTLCLGGDCETGWPSVTGEGGWNDTGSLVELVTSADSVDAGALYIDNTNSRVGIGTTSPSEKLDVVGNIELAGTYGATLKTGTYPYKMYWYYVDDGTGYGPAWIHNNTASGNTYPTMFLQTASDSATLKIDNAIYLGDMSGDLGDMPAMDVRTVIRGGSGGHSYFNTGGNVGIGTTSPIQKLDVAGDIRLSANDPKLIFNDSSGSTYDWDIIAQDNVLKMRWGGGNRFIIDNDQYIEIGQSANTRIHGSGNSYFNAGNVGIGDSTPEDKLVVVSSSSPSIRISNAASDQGVYIGSPDTNEGVIGFGADFNFTGGAVDDYIARDTSAGVLRVDNGNLYYTADTGLTSGNIFTPTDRFTILAGGSVGVGTNSPLAPVHIRKNTDVGSTGPSGTLLIGDVVDGTYIAIDDNEIQAFTSDAASSGTLYLNNDGGTVSVHGSTAGIFSVNSNDLYVTSTGNIGIGTNSPTARFTVGNDSITTSEMTLWGEYQGSGFTNENIFNFRHGGVDRVRLVTSQGSAASNDFDFTIQVVNSTVSGYNDWFTLEGLSGNVGIGTTSPTAPLSISRDFSGGATTALNIMDVSANRLLMQVDTTNTKNIIRVANNYDLEFQDDTGGNIMFLDESSRNVGIGTANPQDKLNILNGDITISNDAGGDYGLTFGDDSTGGADTDYWIGLITDNGGTDNDKLQIGDGSIIGTNPFMTFQTDGNVGIGVTTPSEKLVVNGDIIVQGQDIFMAHDGGTGTNNDYIAYDDSAILGSGGAFIFEADTTRDKSWTSPTAAISASAAYFAGNVGIGATSPGAKLEVVGDVIINSTSPALYFIDTDAQDAYIEANGNRLGLYQNSVESLRVEDSQVQVIGGAEFGVGVTPARFTSTGLGIGTTNPTTPLYVNASRARITLDNTPNGGDIWSVTSGAASGLEFDYGDGSASTQAKMYIKTDGNVGIGTTDPAKTLHVNGTSRFDNTMTFSSSPVGTITWGTGYGGVSGSAFGMTAGSGQSLVLGSNNVAGNLVININGNIGIGTTNDQLTLNINGSTYSDYFVQGNDDVLESAAMGAMSEKIAMYSTTVEYGTIENNTKIYKNGALQVDASSPTVGTFAVSAGDRITSNKPIGLIDNSRGLPIPPISAAGTSHVFYTSRQNPHTVYFYSPYGVANISYHYNEYKDDSPSQTILVQPGAIETMTIDENGTHRFYSTSPVVIVKLSTGGDYIFVPPASREILQTRSTTTSTAQSGSVSCSGSGNIYCRSEALASSTEIGDGAGGDSTMGQPYKMLGDTYVITHPISDFAIASIEPSIIRVYDWTGSGFALYNEYDHTSALRSNPVETEVGDQAGDGADLGLTAPILITGDRPFYLRTNDPANDDEYSVIGYRQSLRQLVSKDSDLSSTSYWELSGSNLYPESINYNVGIGTTSPNRKLEINGTESSLIRINREDNDYGGSIEFYRQGSPEWYLKGGETSGADNFAILNSAAESKFTILQGGNVGIGIVNPSQLLHLNGSGNTRLRIETSSASGQPGIHLRENVNGYDSYIYQNINHDLQFDVESVSGAMVIQDGDGNVGIGTTSPGEKLEVNGSSANILIANKAESEAGLIFTDADDPTNQYAKIMFDSAGTADNELFFYVHDATPRMTINGSNGYVGIGTTSPDYKLQVDSGDISIGQGYALYLDHGDGNPTSIKYAGGASGMQFNVDSASPHMVISNVGNVGIGTASPTAALHVTGTNTDSTPNVEGIQASVTSNYAKLEMTGTSGAYIDFQNDVSGTDYDARIILRGDNSLNLEGSGLMIGSSSVTSSALQVTGDEVRIGDAGTINYATGDGDLYVEDELEVDGRMLINNIEFDESFDYDDSIYFTPQAYFEAESPTTPFLTWNIDGFIEVKNNTVPFSKVALSSSYDSLYSDYIPVNYGETLYGEIWAMRESGASGTAGTLYMGVERFDKDKKPIASNSGCSYFVISGGTVPTDSTWHQYSNYITMPTSHTPYDGSDGGPVRYIRVRILVNYPSGTIPTHWGGVLVRRVQPFRDNGYVSFGGNVGIGTTSPGAKLEVDNVDSVDTGIRVTNTGNQYASMGLSDATATADLRLSLTGTGGYDFGIQDDGDVIVGMQGNVGIGTESPTSKLEVSEADVEFGGTLDYRSDSPFNNSDLTLSVYTTDSSLPYQKLISIRNNDNQATEGLRRLGIAFSLSSESSIGESNKMGAMTVESESGWSNYPSLNLWTNNQKRMTITGQYGNVGIGTTSPAVALDIDSDSNSQSLRLRGADASNEIADIYVNSGGQFILSTTAGSDNSGYIDLRSESSQHGIIIRESDGTSAATPYGNLYVTDASDDYISITVNSATDGDALVVTASDRVGIGTATPNQKLHVSGNTNITGTLSFNAATAYGALNMNNQNINAVGAIDMSDNGITEGIYWDDGAIDYRIAVAGEDKSQTYDTLWIDNYAGTGRLRFDGFENGIYVNDSDFTVVSGKYYGDGRYLNNTGQNAPILLPQTIYNYGVNALKGSLGLDSSTEYVVKKSATTFENTETSFVSVISLINGNFLIAYQNESPSGSGNFIIYASNGTLVKSRTQFDTSSTIYHAMANFGNGNVLIAYEEAGSGGAKFVIYNPNGNLVKSETEFSGGTYFISATSLTNGNVLIAWADNSYSKFAIIDEEGNFVKTETSFKNISSSGGAAITLTNGNILIAYRDGGDGGKGKFVIYDPNGDLVKSETEFESGNLWPGLLSSSTLTNGNVLIAYRDNSDGNKGKFVIYNPNGDLVKSETTFDSNSIGDSLSSSTLTNGNVLIAYKDGGWDGNLVIYDQNGNLVKSLTEFNDNNIGYVSSTTLINGDFVIGYIHGGLPQVGKFQIWGSEGASFLGKVGIGTDSPSEKLELAGGNFLQTAGNPTMEGGVINSTYMDGSSGVYVSGKYAYVSTYGSNSLAVVDISDPSNPQVVGGVINSTYMNTAYGVYVSGKYAYVTGYMSNSLAVVDISDPSNPQVVGGVINSTYLGAAWGVYVSGKYAYVTGYNSNSLAVVDISDPSNPQVVGGVINSTYMDYPYHIYVSGKYAYVAGGHADALAVVDISDPSNPIIVSGIINSTYMDSAYGVYVSGKYAYVTGYTSRSLAVVDISDPSVPTIKGGVINSTCINAALGVYVSGKYAYVVGRDSDALAVVDISDPSNPTILNYISNSNYLDYAQSVYVSGKYAYVTGGISDALAVVDISGIDAPSASIGDISASTIEVTDNVDIGNNLYVRNGINVGPSGLKSDGEVSVQTNMTIGECIIFKSGGKICSGS